LVLLPHWLPVVEVAGMLGILPSLQLFLML